MHRFLRKPAFTNRLTTVVFQERKTTKGVNIQQGRLAQLVQSICLTSRGSAVRIRQRPQKGERLKRQQKPIKDKKSVSQ